jgi:autotransporter translocation and assembly factor TamB
VHITGTESGKGTLLVDVSGRPDQPASVLASLKINAFDLAPVAVFLPGQLVGASGTIDADLTVRGLDTTLANVRGTLHVINGRVPLTPTIGTLRAADALISIDDSGLDAKLDGKIGGGAIHARVTSADGTRATVTAELTKIAPIGAIQPVVHARFSGEFERTGLTWTGNGKISRASILVPEQAGVELLDAAVPDDLIFVDRAVPLPQRPPHAPERPWLIADIVIEPTTLSIPEFSVDSLASGRVQVAIGESIGLDGQIDVERGTVEITGHRYRVESGRVVFDGTTDAMFDLKIAHDFPDVTTFVRFAGRVSTVDRLEPEFTSAPGIYTQGQLLGFFLGGAPGGDPSKETAEAAAGLGASLASSVFGKILKRVPYLSRLQLQFACRPRAGQSSASCSAGRWITDKLYVTGEQRIAARPDENASEGKLEYIWKPNRTVEATGGNRAIFGLDLLWRRRW